jgi:hypothetical protein
MSSDEENEEEVTREAIALRVAQLRARYGALYDFALALFFRNDPMDLNFGDNTDEYSPEVQAILLRIHEASSAEQLQHIIDQEFKRLFSNDDESDLHVARPDGYEGLAHELWREYLECQTRK